MIIIRDYLLQLLKTTPIFLVFSVFVIYFQMQAPIYYQRTFGAFDLNQIVEIIFFHVAAILIYFFMIPAATSKVIFQVNLNDIGLILPKNNLRTWMATLVAFLLLVPSIYFLTKQPSFNSFYTLKQSNFIELAAVIILFPIYYFAEEFFFRGFLFLSLWKRVKWHSFWITDIIFTLSHIGKPGLEILLCIPASVVFNCLTLYTRSIFPAMFVHSAMGIFCILWLNFN